IAVQVVCIGTLPGLAGSERPLADSAAVFMGSIGAAIVTVGALISIFGNLNVGLLSATRILYSVAENRQLPSVIAKTHPETKTPYVSIVLTSLIILVLTVQSNFLAAVAIATITRLLIYATTCLALPVFRGRDDMPKARFTVPFGVACAVLSLVLIVWLLTQVNFGNEGLKILVIAAIGLVLFAATRMFVKEKGEGRA
ncbi:MAG TPA: APC family permease, partial [Pyrinomonadaceae bacterium]|nr:APC family permease [Pyrinomonadaceae bacterium]